MTLLVETLQITQTTKVAITSPTLIRSKTISALFWTAFNSAEISLDRILWRGRNWLKMWWVAKSNCWIPVTGMRRPARIGRGISLKTPTISKRLLRVISITIRPSIKRSNSLVTIEKTTAKHSRNSLSTAMRVPLSPTKDPVATSKMPLHLSSLPKNQKEPTKQLPTRKSLKYWRNIPSTHQNSEEKNLLLNPFASPRVASSTKTPLPNQGKASTGVGNSSDSTASNTGTWAIAAARSATAIRKTWCVVPRRKQRKK